MAKAEDKFNMTISFGYNIVKLNEEGKATPYTAYGPADLEYKNLDYDQIVTVQKTLMGLGSSLVNLGEEAAKKVKD
jgi:hypothetical protein